MKHLFLLAPMLGVLFLATPAAAGDMKMELKLDGSNPRLLPTKFDSYGYLHNSIRPEKDGFRLILPARVEGITPTGLYSLFALSGDCEVTLTYQFLKVQFPKTGYGCGMGLAFDLPDGHGRGDIQRVNRVGDASGYLVHTEVSGQKAAEDHFIPTKATWGRLGLRRMKKELIFLAADEGRSFKRSNADRFPRRRSAPCGCLPILAVRRQGWRCVSSWSKSMRTRLPGASQSGTLQRRRGGGWWSLFPWPPAVGFCSGSGEPVGEGPRKKKN